jgi:branched-chain amino acid aminotransferase
VTTKVVIDGRLFEPEQAQVNVLDRGFLFGDSVFETIRTYAGQPFALDEHLSRLEQSAERVFIPLPVSLAVIRDEILACVKAAANPESYIRVMVTRGSGPLGLDSGFEVHATRVVIVAPLVTPPPEAYEKGVSLITYRTQRVAEATDAVGAKVGNYLVAILATRAAREEGASEALILDAAGCVVEGASSNVFAVIDEKLVTPPEEAGILLGITRRLVLEVAAERGIPVELRAIPLDELYRAEEVFVSSSIRELLPAVRVDGRPVAGGVPGPIARDLLARFRGKVRKIA